MSNTAKTEDRGKARVNINISPALRRSFKAAAAARGEEMTTILLDCIQKYVDKYGVGEAKKGRRK